MDLLCDNAFHWNIRIVLGLLLVFLLNFLNIGCGKSLSWASHLFNKNLIFERGKRRPSSCMSLQPVLGTNFIAPILTMDSSSCLGGRSWVSLSSILSTTGAGMVLIYEHWPTTTLHYSLTIVLLSPGCADTGQRNIESTYRGHTKAVQA